MQGQEIGKLKSRSHPLSVDHQICLKFLNFRITEYDVKQRLARARYQGLRFYSFNCRSPYEHLSTQHLQLEVLEAEVDLFLQHMAYKT